jgi:hypothetical protein
MTYQEHGHPGMWSISIEALERSPDIEVPDTVDEDPNPRDSEGASLHRGHFRALCSEAQHPVRYNRTTAG